MILHINFTLVIQMLVFMAFVWFTMRFVWPPLEGALSERHDKIADGLAAAERGHRELELAQHRVKEELKHAKSQAADILEKAHRRATQLIDESKVEARLEAQKIAKLAEEQLALEVNQAKEQLRKRVASLAVAGAEKIIRRELDEKTTQDLLDTLIEEI
jgi:F-type H+-transporting ATPase subunit b